MSSPPPPLLTPGSQPPGASPSPAERSVARWLGRDRLLTGAVAACALLLGFQLAATLLQPPWLGPATGWLRTAAAWPQLLAVAYASRWLTHRRRPEALSWGLFSVGVLSYAIARTWWTVDDVFIYRHGVPFPILPDLFFVLQYPFYFLAVIFLPFGRFLGPRLLVILDALLLTGAAAALSWYFLLAPLFQMSGLSPLARAMSLGYPVSDLFLLLALSLILLRPLRHEDRPVVGVVIAAVVCLILADAGAIWLIILHPAHVYRTGQFPDLFWLASDLLIPLAALVQVRVVQRAPPWEGPTKDTSVERRGRLRWDDLRAALRFFLPLVAALLASVAILLRATMRAAGTGSAGVVVPLAVSSGLLLLVIIRQGVAFLETARLRREAEAARAREQAARAREQALIELDRRKGEFLSVVSHELRTPLASLQGFLQLLARRCDVPDTPDLQQPHAGGAARAARDAALVQTAFAYSEASVRRLTRLADDLVDDARIRDGRLELHLAPCDLAALVRAAVEEQRALEPERVIRLDLPRGGRPVPVLADADRIAQVVTNLLTNALKYSREERPVAVRLEVERAEGAEGAEGGAGEGGAGEGGAREGGAREGGAVARVSVRDEGVGLPAAAQARVWERFPRIEGVAVQSGSWVSVGLGLSISKAIVAGHHGQVGVESVPGQGSTFWFTLPLARPLAHPSA